MLTWIACAWCSFIIVNWIYHVQRESENHCSSALSFKILIANGSLSTATTPLSQSIKIGTVLNLVASSSVPAASAAAKLDPDPGGGGASNPAGTPLQCWMILNCSGVGLLSVISTLKLGCDCDGYWARMWEASDKEMGDLGAWLAGFC